MTRLFIALLLISSPAYAEDCENPCTLTVQVRVNVYPLADIRPDDCGDNCDMVVEVAEVKHPCEVNPELVGCRYYEGEKK